MLALHLLAVGTSPPTGLLADLQNSPALGVRAAPSFAWIVPPCDASDDATQTAYQIIVSSVDGHSVWDSQKVQSAVSTDAAYAGPALVGGAWYDWTVTTWSENAAKEACTSAPSAKSSFVTRFGNFTEWGAQFIGFTPFDSGAIASAGATANTFTYARKEFTLPFAPSTIVRAAGFVLGKEAGALLCGYRFYLNGELVDVGPGRPEARVWGGDGAYKSAPYTTLDLTARMQGLPANAPFALAFQLMRGPLVFRATIWLTDGSAYTLVSNGTWSVFNGDVERNMRPSHGSAGVRDGVEFIDARAEPVGWREPHFKAGAAWIAAAATALPEHFDATQISSKMEPPLQLTDIASTKTILLPPVPAPTPPPGPQPTTPAACVSADENTVAAIGCPKGEVVTKIDFASFGNPSGTCPAGAFAPDATCNSAHSVDVVTSLCLGKQSCAVIASCATFHETLKPPNAFCWDVKKRLDVKVTCGQTAEGPTRALVATAAATAAAAAAVTANATTHFWVDFGKEFQGGLVLTVADGVAGQTVGFKCGESSIHNTVGSTWGWEFTWTLRDGAQRLEQHKYMECRFVDVLFSGAAPTNWTLGAWKVHYPYVATDSFFVSSDATLNAVYELSRYTLEAASLDTYTDSNTRERRPYEADGIIAATARLLVQRDYLWARHSHAYVLEHPTWPVEWKQISCVRLSVYLFTVTFHANLLTI